MFTVQTDSPVALGSPDHQHPLGTRIDNNTNPRLIEELEGQFAGRRLSVLDIGCSGGQFAVDLHLRGHRAIGLEGSDYSIRHGRANWPRYHGSVLFTADVTRPFQILWNGAPAKFDVITAWEVLEHLPASQLNQVLAAIDGLLDDGGLFFGSIATVDCVLNGVNLHQSVFPRSRWETEVLAPRFRLTPYFLRHAINDLWTRLGESFLFMCRKRTVRKLNLGCGGNLLPSWENHDADMDIARPLPYPDYSYDFLLAEHVLEHVDIRAAYGFLCEARRVLKPGGVVRICVPGVDRIARRFTPEYGEFLKHAGFAEGTRESAIEAILFQHGHRTAWTEELLSILMQNAGLVPAVRAPRRSPHPELQEVDGHWRVIGESNNAIETIVIEGERPSRADLSTSPRDGRMRIGIGLVEHMGDIVACEPVARHMRKTHPDARITWVVHQKYRELVDTHPQIDDTLAVSCLTDWIRAKEGGLFDRVVDLHVDRRVCTLWGSVLRKTEGDPDVDVDHYFRFGGILQAFCRGAGLPPLTDAPAVHIPDAVRKRINELLDGTPAVVIHARSNEECKDWRADRWHELVARILEHWSGLVIEVGLDAVCGDFAQSHEGRYVNLCGRLSILETAEVIRRATAFVGVDSGPAHLANAAGTWGIVLLGEYRIFRTYNPFSGGYADGQNAVLLRPRQGKTRELEVDEVWTAVLDRLAAASPDRLQEDHRPAAAARLIAFYLPQFHPIPENDAWWGRGFTEWTNVAKARPWFEGHRQPHVPGELGYYDLRLPEVREHQAMLARMAGIEGFCYWHYWFNGKRLLNLPLDELLRTQQPDFPFCLAWANEHWTRRWDGNEEEILQAQTYGGEPDDREHFRFLLRAFKDKRYLRVDGKPLFLIYRPASLPDPRRTTACWRRLAEEADLPGLHLVAIRTGFDRQGFDQAAGGFDAVLRFQPSFSPAMIQHADRHYLPETVVVPYADAARVMERENAEEIQMDHVYASVVPGWDNSARRKSGAIILNGSTPAAYGQWLRGEIARVRHRAPDHRIVFVNAWNEWGEGNHLEPGRECGRAYLDATRVAAFQGAAARSSFASSVQGRTSVEQSASGRGTELRERILASPGDSAAHHSLGETYLGQGDVASALHHLAEALALDSDNPAILRTVGNLCVRLGRTDDALAAFEQILRLIPGDRHARTEIARLTAPMIPHGSYSR